MKGLWMKAAAAAAIWMLAAAPALGDLISIDGVVTADREQEVYAPIGGQIAEVKAKPGQNVHEGDVLMTLRTSKIYAEADGRVSGIFGEPGDLMETVVDRYGAAMYIQTDSLYSISASTEYAYSSTETKTIHVGETVYIRASSNQNRKGTGRVTAVSGTRFTVEILTGEFITGEKAFVYRDAEYSRKLKLGYGEITRTSPLGVTTSTVVTTTTSNTSGGTTTSTSSKYSIVRIAVQDGQEVKRGDLLMEVLNGSFDGLYMSGENITADADGTVANIPVSQGSTITKNAVAATLYARDDMCVEAEIPEENLKDIREGDRVTVSLSTDETHKYEGVVRMISGVASQNDSGAVTFTAWIDFTPDDAVRYGSSVLVETKE